MNGPVLGTCAAAVAVGIVVLVVCGFFVAVLAAIFYAIAT